MEGGNVYWLNFGAETTQTGSVVKVPIEGGPPLVLASGQAHPGAIAINATDLYWTDLGLPGSVSGSVMRVALGGSAPATLAAGQDYPDAIAVDANNVYWASFYRKAIMKLPLDGSAPAASVGIASEVDDLAVDSSNLYWASTSAIEAAPLAGGQATVLPKTVESASIAIDGTSAYWTDYEGSWCASDRGPVPCTSIGEVMKVRLGGGTAVTLASGSFKPGPFAGTIAVDATSVYWTSDTSVLEVPIAGGTPVTLACDQNLPEGIAVDGTSLYWTDAGTAGKSNGTVMKLSLH